MTSQPMARSAGRPREPEPFWRRDLAIKRVRLLDVALFASQLRALIGAGVPIGEALGLLAGSLRTSAEGLSMALLDIRAMVDEGHSLGNAFREHEQTFGRLCVEMIATGETTGTLERVLGDVAEDCEHRHKNRSTMVSALVEPVLIVVAGLVVCYVLVTVTVPQFKQLFDTLTRNGQLPLPTRAVLAASDFLTSTVGIALTLGLLAVVVAFVVAAFRSERLKYRLHCAVLHLPLLGDLVLHDAVARASRTLAIVHRSIGEIPVAIELAMRTTPNLRVAEAFASVGADVYQGRMLWEGMRDTGVLPDLAVFMTKSGEESGQLDTLLFKLAETYETSVRFRKERLLMALRYGLLLVMGGLVLGLMLAMYLPVFTLVEQMQR